MMSVCHHSSSKTKPKSAKIDFVQEVIAKKIVSSLSARTQLLKYNKKNIHLHVFLSH